MKKFISCVALVFVSFFAFLIVLKPNICIKAALTGVMLCGNVIIPSIYPFTFCVLFINNSNAATILKPLQPIIKMLWGLNYYEFSLFLLSLIGGYPLGAKLLNESKSLNSALMINYCINAGPAFIILAVGKGVFKNTAVGWVLFLSHIFASIIISLFLHKKVVYEAPKQQKTTLNIVENFVLSASSAADTVIKISALVILFSCISSYIEYFANFFAPLKLLGLLCEVTNAVFKCNNILIVSFLLGFSGFSIWAQIFSLVKNIKINYIKFVFFRLLHGALSTLLTFIALKALKISVSTLSNNVSFNPKMFINTPVVAFSLIIMGIVLIISLGDKKYAGNLIEDIV